MSAFLGFVYMTLMVFPNLSTDNPPPAPAETIFFSLVSQDGSYANKFSVNTPAGTHKSPATYAHSNTTNIPNGIYILTVSSPPGYTVSWLSPVKANPYIFELNELNPYVKLVYTFWPSS